MFELFHMYARCMGLNPIQEKIFWTGEILVFVGIMGLFVSLVFNLLRLVTSVISKKSPKKTLIVFMLMSLGFSLLVVFGGMIAVSAIQYIGMEKFCACSESLQTVLYSLMNSHY